MSNDITIKQTDMPEAMVKVLNPIMKFLLKSPLHGLVSDDLMLLRWRGHKSGTEYTTPVGYARQGETVTVFTYSRWRANFRTPHPAQLKIKGEWEEASGELNEDPADAARFIKQQVAERGEETYRRFRMEIEGDRQPTVEELIPEVEKRDMVLVIFTLQNQ